MKISIVGTGKIVHEVMHMLADELPDKITVTGIYARPQSEENAKILAKETGSKAIVYTGYDQMLEEAEADFVYIANANHVHFQYAMQAMKAGHNVIVEKPITTSRVEMDMLLDMALQKGVYCLPAYSLLYMPLYRQLAQILPQLGTIRMVNGCYAQYSSRYDRYLKGEMTPTFDTGCAGGSLMDLNVYNLCFTIGLFGPPRSAYYMPNKGYNGVDTSGTMLLHYPTFVASLSAAKDSDGHSFACIQGEKGYIEIPGSVSILKEFTVHLKHQEPVTYKADEKHRLNYEFQEFHALMEDEGNCHIRLLYLNSVVQEIARAIDHMEPLI